MIAAEVKYKRTGIDWLEEIPEHWKVVRLKNIVEINARKLSEQTSKNALINYIDITNVNGDGDILEIQKIKFKDAPSRARRILRKNDTIISTVRTYLKAITAIREDDFVGSTGFAVLTPDTKILNSDYLYYYVSSKAFVNKVMLNSVGVAYPAITPTTLACLPFVLPPIEAQNIIVNILNSESAKITRFIQTKQRFIELLKEQRQSVITQAVTKGIDDGVKMKETVLGEIPEHWEVRRLKFCLNEKLRYGANASGDYYNPSWYRYIRITDFTADGTLDESNKLSLSPENGRDYELKDGDILLARSGATVGKSFQFRLVDRNERCCYAGYLIKASANEEIILSDFLYNYTLSSNYENWKNSIFIKATIENISADKYANLLVTLPPIEEQKRILEHIKTETKTLDIAISKAEREIELIKEYREAMIAEAVTGKMKL